MNTNDFEKYIDSKILDRGRKYYKEGRVAELCENDYVYNALVEGTECYDVMVETDAKGEIVDHNCNCPYDLSNICKHKVAVLFAIKFGEVDKSTVKANVRKSSNKEISGSLNVQNIIKGMNRAELVDKLLGLAEKDNSFAQEIVLQNSTEENIIGSAKRLIKSFIRKEMRSGFVGYGRVDSALEGADKVMNQAREFYCKKKYIGAVELSLLVLSEVARICGCCDDSNGETSWRIDDCISLLTECSQDAVEEGSPKLLAELFKMIMKESNNSVYDGWYWDIELLNCCISFCKDKQLKDILWNNLENRLIQAIKEKSNYKIVQIKCIQHRILVFTDEAQAFDFEKENIKYPEFRIMLIERDLKSQNYKQALILCKNQHFSSAADYRFKAYKGLGNTSKIREEAYNAMDYKTLEFYYYEIMNTYQDSEKSLARTNWLGKILQKFKQSYIPMQLLELLVKEKEFHLLLNCCYSHNYLIEEFYKFLTPLFYEDAHKIYIIYLDGIFSKAYNRKQYVKCCQSLRKYKKAFGSEKMKIQKDKYKSLFPLKKALLEELCEVE